MLNCQLVLPFVIISILISYISYWDEQKHRTKGNSFSPDAWKGLPEGFRVLFCIFFSASHSIREMTGLTHGGYSFVRISDVHKNRAALKRQGFFRGRALGEGSA